MRLIRPRRFTGHSRVRARVVTTLVLLVGCGSLASAPAASALSARGHVFAGAFGSDGEGEVPMVDPTAVAVSEVGPAAGDVYVVDRGGNRIMQFDAAGKFVAAWGWGVKDGAREYEVCDAGEQCKAGTPGAGLGLEKFHLSRAQLVSPTAIAVDDSTDPSDPSRGDVYVVADAALEKTAVYKFGPNGEYKGHLTTKTESEFDERAEGVAVDSSGVVWVEWGADSNVIVRFDDGEPNRRIAKEEEIAAGVEPLRPGFAVGPEDGLYVDYEPGEAFQEATDEASRYSEEGRGEHGEEPCEASPCLPAKLVGLAEPIHELLPGAVVSEDLYGESTSGIAVDPRNHDVYLDNVSKLTALTAAGKLIQQFGAGQLKEGRGLAVNGQGDVFAPDASSGEIDMYAPEPAGAPTVSGLSVENVTPTAAQFAAAIDPEGASGATSYRFEYGTSRCDSGPSACSELAEGQLGGASFGEEGFGEVEVHASAGAGAATGALVPETTYYYRVLASNEHSGGGDAEAESEESSFTTPPASEQGAADGRVWELVSPADAEGAEPEALTALGGTIQSSADGQSLTYVTDGPIGSPEGNRSLEVTQMLACSSRAASCAEAQQGAQGWRSRDIVTANEHGNGIELGKPPEYQLFSSDLSLSLLQPFPEGGGALEEPPLSPPATSAERGHQEKTLYLRDDAPIEPDDAEQADYTAAAADGTLQDAPGYLALVSGLDTASGTEFGQQLRFAGATADLSHVVISSQVALTAGFAMPASGENLYEWAGPGSLEPINVLPGSEGAPASDARLGANDSAGSDDVEHAISDNGARVFWSAKAAGGEHLYMRDTVSRETIQLDVVQAGAEGLGAQDQYRDNPVFQDASSEGSEVFFTDEERLTTNAGATGGKPDLYAFDVASGQLTDLTPAYAGESANVQGIALGASEDGAYVYFVADGVLSSQAAADTGAGHCAAVEGEPVPPDATCNLYLVHDAGQPGAVAWEAPHFLAALSSEDEPDWGAPRVQSDLGGDLGYLTARVSPNGRYLAFMSQLDLTGDYDNRASAPSADGAPAEEVFLYDAQTGRLVCASCDPSGSRPVGVFDPEGAGEGEEGLGLLVDRTKVWEGHWLAGSIPGWTKIEHFRALYQSRYLSNDGRLYFDSPDALVPQDVNGKEDVYEYEPQGVPSGAHRCSSSGVTYSARAEGCIALISSGTGTSESAFLDASVSGGEGASGEQLEEGGGDVFFVTAAKLVPQDTDTSFDVYDAHECTNGSPCIVAQSEAPPTPCEGTQSCRPASTGSPPAGEAIATGETPVSGDTPTSTAKPAQQSVLASKQSAKPKPLTRARKLADALRVCKRITHKKTRTKCEAQARRRYGPAKRTKAKRAAHKQAGR